MTTPAVRRHRLFPFLKALLPAALVLAAGCSASESTESTESPEAAPEVVIAKSRFEPKEIRAESGVAVRFVNTDPFAHTVTAADSGIDFDSGDMGQDDVFEISFDEPGTYAFFCAIHPTMRGTVEVG